MTNPESLLLSDILLALLLPVSRVLTREAIVAVSVSTIMLYPTHFSIINAKKEKGHEPIVYCLIEA